MLNQSGSKNLLSDSHRSRLQSQLNEKIAEIWETVKGKVKDEWERQAREIMGEMYKEIILTKEYSGSDLQ